MGSRPRQRPLRLRSPRPPSTASAFRRRRSRRWHRLRPLQRLFRRYYYVETFGAGAAFLDYDGDDRLDLYLANGTYLTGHPPDPPPINRLYRNAGAGTFTDVTAHSGSADPGYGFGVAAADYDADGDPTCSSPITAPTPSTATTKAPLPKRRLA